MTGFFLVASVSATAFADLVAIGDPFDGGSWFQRFATNNISLDFLAVEMISSGDTFESTVNDNFGGSFTSGWADSYTGTTPLIGIAQGPLVAIPSGSSQFQWDIHFAGVNSDPLSFVFYAFNGDALTEWVTAHYKRPGYATWSYEVHNLGDYTGSRDELALAIVPLPTASALAGLGLLGIGVRRRRGTL